MSFAVVAGTNSQYSSASSGTTYLLQQPSSTIPAGSFVAGIVACNNASMTVPTIADNSTQAGAANTWTHDSPGGLTDLAYCVFFCMKTTRAILTTDTVTVTQGAAATRRAGTLNAFSQSNAAAAWDSAVGVPNSGFVTASPVSFTVPAQTGAGELIIEFAARTAVTVGASGYSHTAPAGWTAGTRVQSPSTTPTIEVGVTWIASSASAASFTNTATYTVISRAFHEVQAFTDTVAGGPTLRQLAATGVGR